MLKSVHDTRDAPRQRDLGKRHAVPIVSQARILTGIPASSEARCNSLTKGTTKP